jgi:hypothetical protein
VRLYCPICGCPDSEGCTPLRDLTLNEAGGNYHWTARVRCHNQRCPVPPPYFNPLDLASTRIVTLSNS